MPSDDVELAINYIPQHMADALIEGDRIEIRSFGSFSLRHRPARISRNPKTAEVVNLPSKAKIHFKSGKELRDRINAARDQYPIES
jgi:integration host factor subunit beta